MGFETVAKLPVKRGSPLSQKEKERAEPALFPITGNARLAADVTDQLIQRQEHRDHDESDDATHTDDHDRLQH